MSERFDVTVIGAGPAGYVAAIRAAQLGLKTAIVERQYWGGVCLNLGCIPAKTLIRNAEVAHILHNRAREFGFSFENLQLDYSVGHRRSRRVSGRLVKGVKHLIRKNDIAAFEGNANIVRPQVVEVTHNDGGVTRLQTEYIIIATGARPSSIPGVEIDGEKIITYKEAILSPSLPDAVIIIGGGPIGVEFAYIWRNYGVEVTIVEMLDQLLPQEDPESSRLLARAYQKLKIKVLTGAQVEEIAPTQNGIEVTVRRGDQVEALAAQQALMAIGNRPNVENLGLEKVGIQISSPINFVQVDDRMQTNVPNIFAVGDVTGKLMLAHAGSAMGVLAAEVIAGLNPPPLAFDLIPRCTYAHPQVASFGLTEAQAREEGFDIQIGRFPFQANGKALGLGERDGFVKILSDGRTGELLGAHLVGPGVTELLPELTLAGAQGLTAAEIARNVHAHPTLSEALMEAAHAVEGWAIHV